MIHPTLERQTMKAQVQQQHIAQRKKQKEKEFESTY
jgi:hypothetical protein